MASLFHKCSRNFVKFRVFSVLLVLLVLFATNIIIEAQSPAGLNPELKWRYMRQAYKNPSMHTIIQPWYMAEIQEGDSGSIDQSRSFHYFIHPLANVQLAAGASFRQRYGAGVHAGISLGKSLSVDFNYALNGRQFPGCEQAYIDTTGLIPHYDRYLTHHNDFYLFQSLNFSISWTPVKYITVRAGKDRQFWGDGYRSMYLSDNADSYPFLQTIFKVWHIKYMFMTTRMSDYQLSEHFSARHKKFTSMHTLSWNITPGINVNLFETVVWDAVDSVSKRTFDMNYMNPVVVLRPVDYSLGSPDNILIGFGAKVKVWRELYLYGQLVLDEFKFDELKAANGWWANKYAFQAGARCFLGEQRPAMLQAEFNQVRPYNGTHYYTLQNYGHLADPLAHPMGANLREGLVIARWAFAPKWSAHAMLTYAVQGTDSVGTNFGGDIYKSNLTRMKEYGNKTLQGVRATTAYQELKIARTLVEKWNLQAEVVMSNRLFRREGKTQNDFYFSIGVKTLLYRD
ncbi:MAG: hypothetical protein LBL04_07560 [Bacteroidales bacterium]|nr:hypothetical protein [Bacteroidales bacterium]